MSVRGCVLCRFTVDDHGEGHHAPDCPTLAAPDRESQVQALRAALEEAEDILDRFRRKVISYEVPSKFLLPEHDAHKAKALAVLRETGGKS